MTRKKAAVWRCKVCGYVHRGPEPPEKCPICGADASEFELADDAGASTAGWRCLVCGYVHEADTSPDQCPACGATADCFETVEERHESGSGARPPVRAVVVGAGIAGIEAAETIAQTAPGSEIVLIASEPDAPYYRLNLTRYLAGDVTRDELVLHPEAWYREHGIALIPGVAAQALDLGNRSVQLANGHSERYEKLVITTGAQAFVPPVPGADLDNVFGFRTIVDADRILDLASGGNPCVCIGGGLLGLETAGALTRRGVQVAVVETQPWLMPRQLNERASKILQRHIERIGVRLHAGAAIQAIEGHGSARCVVLGDGTRIEAGFVVFSTGIRPDLGIAREAGLSVNRGIVVNDLLETSREGVYAAGDVAEHREQVYGIWPASQYQGRIAGKNAAGNRVEFAGIPRSTTLKVLDIGVTSIGEVQEQTGDTVIDGEDDAVYRRFMFRDGRLIGGIFLGEAREAAAALTAIERGEDLSAFLAKQPRAVQVAEYLAEQTG